MEPRVDIYDFSEKWSSEIAQYNFTQVPNLLLGCQGHLDLTDGELLTLIHLLTFWFSTKSRVFPSITTLTKFSHKGYSTIQKRLRILEEKGFVKRRYNFGTSNTFDLTPCVQKLRKHQKVCASPPHKQGDDPSNSSSVPTSNPSNKEYQHLRIPNNNIWNFFAESIPQDRRD